MYCNQCGHRNPPDSNFCSSCGAALEAGQAERTITFMAGDSPEGTVDEDITVHLEDIAEGTGLLVVRRGPNAGSRFLLDTDVTRVGRHPASDILLDDITVSRRHAEFVRQGHGYIVRDVGSLNGTYVNRQRTDRAELAHGDEVQIGKFKLVFLSGMRTG